MISRIAIVPSPPEENVGTTVKWLRPHPATREDQTAMREGWAALCRKYVRVCISNLSLTTKQPLDGARCTKTVAGGSFNFQGTASPHVRLQRLTFIVDGIDDMHRTGRKAARPPWRPPATAGARTRREATANMVQLEK